MPNTADLTLLPEGGPNPVAVAARTLANGWNVWVIELAMAGMTRFSDWMTAGPVSSAALTGSLRTLTDVGVFSKVQYSEHPARFEYRLTARGEDLWQTLLWLWEWETRWARIAQEHVSYGHRECSNWLRPVLRCQQCERVVVGREMSMVVGPSGGWKRSIPDVANRRRARSGSVLDVPDATTLIGDKWSWAVLGAAFRGVRRYSEFTQFLGGPPPTISDRLKSFCEIGVMEAAPDPHRPNWYDYRLTTKGRAFLPVILASVEWGQDHFRSPDGKALVMRHELCGSGLRLLTTCAACDHPVTRDSLVITPGAFRVSGLDLPT